MGIVERSPRWRKGSRAYSGADTEKRTGRSNGLRLFLYDFRGELKNDVVSEKSPNGLYV